MKSSLPRVMVADAKAELRRVFFKQVRQFQKGPEYQPALESLRQQLHQFIDGLPRPQDRGLNLLVYKPFASELPIDSLVPTGHELYFPLVVGRNMVYQNNQGNFMPLYQFDFVFLPGLFIDREGYRLGRGGGYYDRALRYIDRGKTAFAGFHWQLKDQVPREGHDRRIGFFISEKTVLRF